MSKGCWFVAVLVNTLFLIIGVSGCVACYDVAVGKASGDLLMFFFAAYIWIWSLFSDIVDEWFLGRMSEVFPGFRCVFPRGKVVSPCLVRWEPVVLLRVFFPNSIIAMGVSIGLLWLFVSAAREQTSLLVAVAGCEMFIVWIGMMMLWNVAFFSRNGKCPLQCFNFPNLIN